ncbi:MAG TPA: hypothetical protein VFU10_10965 [Gaiellaceae bacterium]|nr:hypothetical protein [Gaiellaceae bacterium]
MFLRAEGEIRMHHCPYRDGALAELGSGLEVDRLEAFVEPSLCVAWLSRRAS